MNATLFIDVSGGMPPWALNFAKRNQAIMFTTEIIGTEMHGIGGGTDFNAPLKYAREHGIKKLRIITDGQAIEPDKELVADLEITWLIVESSENTAFPAHLLDSGTVEMFNSSQSGAV